MGAVILTVPGRGVAHYIIVLVLPRSDSEVGGIVHFLCRFYPPGPVFRRSRRRVASYRYAFPGTFFDGDGASMKKPIDIMRLTERAGEKGDYKEENVRMSTYRAA